MVAKKKPASKARKKRGSKIPSPAMRLRGKMLLEFKAAVAEYQAAEARLRELTYRVSLEKSHEVYRPLLALLSKLGVAKDDMHVAARGLNLLNKTIADKLSLTPKQFESYVVNTDSGQVTFMPAQEKKQMDG